MFPKRLDRTIIYENPWVNLYVDKVLFPDGRLIEKHHLPGILLVLSGIEGENRSDN